MGSGFSSGPFPKLVKRLVNLDMVEIRKGIETVDRMINKRYKDDTYMTRNQFQKCFQLSDALTYSLFRIFDPNGDSRVMSLDVWGAIVLASSSRIEEKLKLLFEIADINKDNYMGRLDCEMLMRCASRGFSRMKGIPVPENGLVKKMVDLMFDSNVSDLSEFEEVSTFTFREFFTICDSLQTYVANLGTEATAIDIQKLILQRADLIKEIAELETRIEHISYNRSIEEEDVQFLLADRGGDSRLLLLNEDIDEPHEPSIEELRQAHETRMTNISRADRESQRNRRIQRAVENGVAYVALDEEQVTANDAEAFTREDTGGGGSGVGSVSDGITIRSLIEIEKLLEFRWRSFTPQTADKLVKLDIDKIEDLFESAGVRLTDKEATECLETLHANQLGRHSLADVLKWFERKHFIEMVNGVPRPTDPPPKQYVLLGCKIKDALEGLYACIQRFATVLEKQSKVANELDLLDKRRKGKPHLLQLEQTVKTSLLNSTSFLASWHRRRNLDDTSNISFSIEFGKDLDSPEEEDTASPAASPGKMGQMRNPVKSGGNKPELASEQKKESKMTRLKNAMKSVTEGSNWKFQVQVHAHMRANNTQVAEKSLLDKDGCLRMHPGLLTHTDVTSHFKVSREEHEKVVGETAAASSENEKGPGKVQDNDADKKKKKSEKFDDSIYCKTAVWLSLMCRKGMSFEQAEITRETLHRTFDGIPFDNRKYIYRYTKSQAFRLPPVEERSGPDYLGEKCIPPIAHYDYVVVLALLHDDDAYESMESLFTGGNVAITRALWDLSVSFNLHQDLSELVKASREYDNYDARLFGPQEEEIGEEGMNPIRFAKACRKRRQELESAADAATKMSVADLRATLAAMGLNNKDKTRDVLIARIQRAYKHKLSLVGSGELSEFGKSVVCKIFDIFDEDRDGGLSLWEMNKLLYSVNTPTIPHAKEYERIMTENDFLGDDNGFLTKLGLCAYYERYGRLANDMAVLGIGSMDEFLSGEFNVSIKYDPEAVCTLMPLLKKHTLTQIYFKKMLNVFCTLKNMTWDAKVEKLSDIFDIFRDVGLHDYIQYLCGGQEGFDWLQYVATAPGMISNLIDSLSQFLADGEIGVMREMKLAAAEKVPKFAFYNFDWDPVFDKIVHRMLVSFEDITKFSDEDSDEDDDGIRSETDAANKEREIDTGGVDHKTEGKKAEVAGSKNNVSSILGSQESDNSCLRGFLPPLIPTTNLGSLITTMFDDAKKALLGLQGAIRVTRKQREILVRSQREWERGCVSMSRLKNEAVATWPIHASALYDCLRVFSIDLSGVGFGTPEFGAQLLFKGLSFESFNLPKADGAPCPTKKILFDKIYRALQRKAAALAAIDRQKERARLEKEQAEREAREELERQRRMMDPQVIHDEEENGLIRTALKTLDRIRDFYMLKNEAIEAERLAKEAELARLGMIDAPLAEEAPSEAEEHQELLGAEMAVINSRKPKKSKVLEVHEHRAYLWEAGQEEVSNALQLWYDILELRESRYRLKPLRILRIAVTQNNISMLLVEYYIHFRKSSVSQRRMTEASNLLSFMADTVNSWLSREADIDLTEARELAEIESRSKSKGGSRGSTLTTTRNESSNEIDRDIEEDQCAFNPIIDGLFPEERDAALPDLRKRGLSAVPIVMMLQNYVSFVRHTIAVKNYFIENKPASRSGSAMFSTKLPASASSRSRMASPERLLASSIDTRAASPQAVRFGEAEVLVIDHGDDTGNSASLRKPPDNESSVGNEPLGFTAMFADELIPVRKDFVDYQDFIEYSQNCDESVYLRCQTRIHGLISQLTEKEAGEIATKKFNCEITPIFMLPANFFRIVKQEVPAARSSDALKLSRKAIISDEKDPERRKEDENCLREIASAIESHGERSYIVAERLIEFGAMLANREGEEDKAIIRYEEALSIQLEVGGKFSESSVVTMKSLAKLQERMGKHKEALSTLYAVLERYAHMKGQDSPEIVDALKSIATLFHSMGRRDACLTLLKRIRQMEKLLRQNTACKNKVSKTFIEVYGELANLTAALNEVAESDKLFKATLNLSSRFLNKKESQKYSLQYTAFQSRSRCPSPDARPEFDHAAISSKENSNISRSLSMPPVIECVSAVVEEEVESESSKLKEEETQDDLSEIWRELNTTCDEVIARREFRQKQRNEEKARLKAILDAEEAERKRLRDALESPEMLAIAAKKARQEAIRRKREKAEAMRNASVQRRARLYEMINNDQITAYFNAVSNSTEESSHLNWNNQDAAGITDPFADLDATESRPTTGEQCQG